MYCKYCGAQIANNSIYCPKCGNFVFEATKLQEALTTSKGSRQWIPTNDLQWKKPIIGRCVQVMILCFLGLFSLYTLCGMVSGGKVTEYPKTRNEQIWDSTGRMHTLTQHTLTVYVEDPLGLKILLFTKVIMSNEFGTLGSKCLYRSQVGASYAKNVFRVRMLLMLLPIMSLAWLIVLWIKRTRFPDENDIMPRDVADEIEHYRWYGFTKCKYIFFRKNGKYGIIDARNYCVIIPAQYDSIAWRITNKTFDVTIEDEKKTKTIALKQNIGGKGPLFMNDLFLSIFSLSMLALLIIAFSFGGEAHDVLVCLLIVGWLVFFVILVEDMTQWGYFKKHKDEQSKTTEKDN